MLQDRYKTDKIFISILQLTNEMEPTRFAGFDGMIMKSIFDVWMIEVKLCKLKVFL